jgi:hypothetical protein
MLNARIDMKAKIFFFHLNMLIAFNHKIIQNV